MSTATLPRNRTDVRTLRTGREYLRVSRDRSGRQRSPEEQNADNQRAADRLRITLGEPYRETDAVSASRYSKKTRAGYDRLIADLEHDRFGADVPHAVGALAGVASTVGVGTAC